MIYLRFTEGAMARIEAVIVTKPNFEPTIEDVLSKYYQKDIATRYSQAIASFIHENMAFPEDGIYHVEDQTFRYFDVQRGIWTDTQKGPSDYVIEANSEIWNCFKKEFKFLKAVSNPIKEVVKTITEGIFERNDWEPITSIVMEKRHSCNESGFYLRSGGKSNPDSMEKVLRKFFSGEVIPEISWQVRKSLFGAYEGDYAIVTEESIAKYALFKDTVIRFDKGEWSEVRKTFADRLQEEDTDALFKRLKNMLLFAVDTDKIEVTQKKEDGRTFGIYKGHKVLVQYDGKMFIRADEKLLHAMKKALSTIQMSLISSRGEKYAIDGSTDLYIIPPGYNGIRVPFDVYCGKIEPKTYKELPYLERHCADIINRDEEGEKAQIQYCNKFDQLVMGNYIEIE